MRKIQSITFALAFVAGISATAPAQRSARVAHSAGVLAIPVEEPGDSLYRVGRQAMTDGDYRRAANLLKQVADKYPSAKSAPDALYYCAWSLHRLGVDRRSSKDLDDALESIDRLEKEYPKATAMSDARALRGTIRSAQASLGNANAASDIARGAKGLRQQKSCTGSKEDEEMRMAALDGLMSMNSADAIPILQDVLKQRDECRIEMRKKAVFLLSQKRGSGVAATLLDVARNDPSTEVRGDAITWLGQTQSDVAIAALDSILFQSKDEEIRKKAIFALSQQSRDERARAALRRAADDERMPEEIRSEAIFWLGQTKMADLDFFKTLFRKTRDIEVRKKIIFAVSQSNAPGSGAWLLEMARDKSFDTEIRKDAIFQASQQRTLDLEQLASIYEASKGDDELQNHIIFVYTQRREPAAVDKLMSIAKNDTNIEMRKQALFWLGQSRDPRVKQFILDLIKK